MRSTSPDNRLLVSQTRKWETRRRLWRNVLEGCAREGEPRCAAIESLELHPPLVLESRVLSGLCVLGRLLGTNVIATSVRRTHVAAMAPKQKNHKRQQQQQQEFYSLIGRRTGLNSRLFLLPGVFCLPSELNQQTMSSRQQKCGGEHDILLQTHTTS